MTQPKPNFGTNVRSSGRLQDTVPGQPRQDQIGDAASWAVNGEMYIPVPKTTHAMPSAFYAVEWFRDQPVFRQMVLSTDALIRLPDETTDMLEKEFVTFWERLEKFRRLGLSSKRGLLLWGPPGSGKTSTVQVMAQHMISALGGVVVMAGVPHMTIELLQRFRQVEPDRPLVVVYEDIDAMVERYGEPELLAMLDGEHQISNVVNVATTNYPERLDARFADRPGRFDRVQYVGMPNPEARRVYLKERGNGITEDQLDHWVKASDGWSIAHLRELIVAHSVLGENDAEIIDRLESMRITPSSDKAPDAETQTVGFA